MRAARLLLMVLLASLGESPQVVADDSISCSQSSQLDKAYDLRVNKGKPRDARDLAKDVLNSDRGNLRASYTLGLSLIDLAAGKPSNKESYAQGMDYLVHVSDVLDANLSKMSGSVKACLKQQGVLTVNNSLANYYLVERDLTNADKYLTRAGEIDRRGLLTQKSQARYLANLGTLSFKRGQNQEAEKYFKQAQALGDNSENVTGTLAALRVIQKVTGSER